MILYICLTSVTDREMMPSLVFMADIPKWSWHHFPLNPGIALSSPSTQISRWLLSCYQCYNVRCNLISMTELKYKLTDIIDYISFIFASQKHFFSFFASVQLIVVNKSSVIIALDNHPNLKYRCFCKTVCM